VLTWSAEQRAGATPLKLQLKLAGAAADDTRLHNVLLWWRDAARGGGGRFDLHGMTKAQFKDWATDLAWCLRQLDGATARVRLPVVTGQGRLSRWLREDCTLWESNVTVV
jgi:hypothetical protein